jgi:predicted transposase YbfD/YdcC
LPKKTTKIIIDSGNDYVIAVKKNQPELYNTIEKITQHTSPFDMDYTLERNRGRIEHRSVMLYNSIGIDKAEWKGIRQVVQVHRRVEHSDGHESFQEAFYIDSSAKTANELNQGIRQHWSVESMHWIKDTVLKEDDSKIHTGKAPQNLSIIRDWTIAVFRINNYKSIVQAIRLVANDIRKIIELLE